jgi:hypothetical protein
MEKATASQRTESIWLPMEEPML